VFEIILGLSKIVVPKTLFTHSTAIAILSAGQFLDGEKAKKELGYAPSVTTNEAIKKTVDWFKMVGYIS
jgi:nucleoside-diphosphate-sugar epimerase